jgi:uncharacterized protein (DUF433 family)
MVAASQEKAVAANILPRLGHPLIRGMRVGVSNPDTVKLPYGK